MNLTIVSVEGLIILTVQDNNPSKTNIITTMASGYLKLFRTVAFIFMGVFWLLFYLKIPNKM